MRPTTITSPHNPRVKDAIRLRERRQRDRQSRIIIDGARELGRAAAVGVRLNEVFVCESLCHTAEARELMARLPQLATDVLRVSPEVFTRLAFGDRSDGFVGVAETPHRTLAELSLPADALLAVLVGVEKPGNVGAVLRSADAAGLAALIVADGATDLFNPNAIRASLGTIFTVPVAETTSTEALAWLRKHDVAMIAAQVNASAAYTSAMYAGRRAIVLGSEAHGLPDAWSAADILPVSLPMRGVADSLNVAATAAVLFYEALRQREAASRGGTSA